MAPAKALAKKLSDLVHLKVGRSKSSGNGPILAKLTSGSADEVGGGEESFHRAIDKSSRPTDLSSACAYPMCLAIGIEQFERSHDAAPIAKDRSAASARHRGSPGSGRSRSSAQSPGVAHHCASWVDLAICRQAGRRHPAH